MSSKATISSLPSKPAVYALMSGSGRGEYVAYVGIAKNLRQRINQHLVLRDSSVATGTTAACLNPDYVSEVRWWQHGKFRKKYHLEAAEIFAQRILDPTLRSRGRTSDQAKKIAEDAEFAREMSLLFGGDPTGTLDIPNLQAVVERLERVEEQLAGLRRALQGRRK